jgi:hypothetical protein
MVSAFTHHKQMTVRLYHGRVVIKPVEMGNKLMNAAVYLSPGQEFVYGPNTTTVRLFGANNNAIVNKNNTQDANDNPSLPVNTKGSWHMYNNQPLAQVLAGGPLKVSALLAMFKAVRAYVKAQQLPLLNLSPSSFRVFLPEVGEQFPALWANRITLAKPGQAYLLKIEFTEQKYFVRLGKTEPSPFLPEGLGAHSFGVGSVRIRNVISERDGIVLEGTLVAEDYLGLDAHDMLWF